MSISLWRKRTCTSENAITSLALALMVVLPLTEIAMRRVLHTGISNSSAIVQHLSLIVGMLGGALAARENRLLAISSAVGLLKGRKRAAASVFASAVACTVSVFLCLAGLAFVRAEKPAHEILTYGIPIWFIQAVLPLGFALIALRLLWKSSSAWLGRLATGLMSGAGVWLLTHPPTDPPYMVVPCLVVLVIATALGTPVFATIGGTALVLFWGQGIPTAAIPITHYSLVTNPSLPAIPLFTLAGFFLAEGGASRRLVRVFQALFGSFRGGPAVMTALVCAFFTSFTGASGVTILALGGLLMPVLLAARYTERNALGLLTGAGSLGLLFPPSLPLILYAIISTQAGATVTIKQMFLGGILPGCVMVLLTALWGVLKGPKDAAARQPFNAREAASAVWAAKWELLLPIVAQVGLFGGFATPVEAAAMTALYAFLAETVIYRDLKFGKDTLRVMTECGLLIGGVFLILGVAQGLTNYLVDAQIPSLAVEWAPKSLHSPVIFLLMLNVFLLLVGCLMDIYSATVVVVPLIVPLGQVFGVEPVHLGIIFLANMELGFMMPPVGMNLLISSYRFQKPLPVVYRSVLPMLLVLLVGVLLITYIPPITTLLPSLFAR